jgi:hypothetical protein
VRVWRFFAWFVVIDTLITMFGVMTAPLLLILAVDANVAVVIIRDCLACYPRRRHTTRATTDAVIRAVVVGPAPRAGAPPQLRQNVA